MILDFDKIDGAGDMNVEKGKSLLTNLSKADLESSIKLMTSDGSVDGAFYLIYLGLSQAGQIQNVKKTIEAVEAEDVIMSLDLLKYIMYNCFIIGAEASKSVNQLDDLWNRTNAEEPERNDNTQEETS